VGNQGLIGVWREKEPLISPKRDEFEQAVRAYGAILYRFAYWLCRDRHLAEDIVQDACLRAWNAWSDLRDPSQAKVWLMAIVRNEYLRSRSRSRNDLSLDDVDENQLPQMLSFAERLETEEMVSRLPGTYREPLLLQVLGGFTCAEIAGILGTSEGAVMTRLTRARQALRQRFASANAVRGTGS